MNFTSDQLFDKVILNSNSYLSESDRNKIVEDLLYLQKLAKPMGILKETSVEKLVALKSHTLVLIHKWQSEMYAMKYFKEISRTPHQTIFGFYV